MHPTVFLSSNFYFISSAFQLSILLDKLRIAVFFQWFVCRVSPKVGLLKRWVRSHVVKAEIKNCMLLWWQKHFFLFHMLQNCTALWRKAHFKSKCTKHVTFGPFFEHSQIPVWCLHNGQWQWNNGTMNNDNGTMEQWSMEQWTVEKCVWGRNNGEKWNAFQLYPSY